jgi:voltage-gated potassium channel
MDERSERIARRFDVPMLIAALLVVPVLILQESNVAPGLRPVADVLNWIIWLAFVTEVVVMLLVVPHREPWLRRHPLEVTIALFTAPLLPASLQALRLVRLLRVLRLLKLVPSARRVFSVDGVRLAGVLTALVVLGGGAAFHAVENGHGRHVSLWDGVWWAASTVTTAGSGNIYPHTTAGRAIAIVVMASGIGFVALLTGALAQRFLAADVERVVEDEQRIETEITADAIGITAELRDIARRINALEQQLAQSERSRQPGL